MRLNVSYGKHETAVDSEILIEKPWHDGTTIKE